MLIPAFTLKLNNAVLHKMATVGRYDGANPCLTCATSGGKVLIHHPHERDANAQHTIRFLNIERTVTALKAGRLAPVVAPAAAAEAEESKAAVAVPTGKPGAEDTLFIGSQTNLLAFDVERNSDKFYCEVPDGVNALILGSIPGAESPLAIVGGNCSLQGFDDAGTEQYWTVTGDNVTALSFCDVEEDGINELLVGSEDMEIRIYQREEVVVEVVETDVITELAPVHHTRFAYALANGTVGVYDRAARVWRVKSKHKPRAVGTFDLDADGVPEVVTGWSSGKLDVRKEENGEVVFKDAFPSAVSAIVQADYRSDGAEEIICCSLDGEVRGYLPISPEMQGQQADNSGRMQAATAVKDLLAQKAELELQLRGVEENLKQYKGGGLAPSAMPPDTQVTVNTQVNAEKGCCELVVATSNATVVRSVVVLCLDSGVFPGESVMFAPATPASRVVCPLRPETNTASELLVKVLVAARGTTAQYHVFELQHRLVKFAMFTQVRDATTVAQPASSVEFQVSERVNRLVLWLQQCFYYDEAAAPASHDSLLVAFRSLRRDGQTLLIHMSQEGGARVAIYCDDMDLAAEIVQDLCSYWQVTEMESVAHFPTEMEAFREVLMRVDDFNATRLQLTAEMADQSHHLKTLVIRSEDARLLGDMPLMRRLYADLFTLNNQLIGEYNKRSGNHQALLAALKDVNKMIQKASHLRVGHARTRVVSACRNAIKTNNITSLFQIIKHGRETSSG